MLELLLFDSWGLSRFMCCSARSAWSWTFCNTLWNNICVEELTRRCSDFSVCQTMSGAALVDDRSGVTFDVELCVPWDAPEAVVDIDSVEVVTLGSFPDKVGLFGRRKDAAVSRIMQGRDSGSIRFLVPDARGLDQNFHDVTIVDMDDEREPTVTPADMTRLCELWPPEIFNHMRWFQQDLELMRKSAKREFSQLRPMPCKFCGKEIRVDMYRHVARLHLDLVQLWRCPIAWCTTWKGSPQDFLEHVRNGHDVLWISKTTSIEKYAPPWTVRRELWTDSLRVEHSGISTDILLFSELGLSLKQHYRVYRGGLPHAVFRTDYMQRLRALLPSPRLTEGETALPTDTGRGLTPKSARRLHRSSRPMRRMSEAVDDGPLLTVQNPAEMIGETVIDCRPSVLPVSIPLCSLSPATVAEAREISGCKPSQEPGRSIMDMDTSEITISRIVGFQWDDPGTDVEDELPAPVLSPVQIVAPVIPPTEAADLLDRGDGFDLDLAKVMLDVSVMPPLISPIEECEVPPSSEAAGYAAPATPALATVIESPGYSVPEDVTFTWVPEYVPVPETFAVDEERQTRSPEHLSPNTVSASVVIPVVNTVTLEQCSAPTPAATEDRGDVISTKSVRQTERAQVFLVEATNGSLSSVSCQDNQDIGPDLTREGPFDVSEVEPDPGQSPLVLNSMPGCQFRMTSYDEQDSRGDLDPAYGIHLHDPRMMEYMGAPESARLFGRSPEYWLQHMGRDRAVAVALRLHHDASLIMTNVQVMSQFVTSLNRTASEVMRMVYDKPPFPTDAVEFVTPGRRVRRAAHYMAAMGLWRPTSAPVFPGPIPISSCNSRMACADCFPDAPQ